MGIGDWGLGIGDWGLGIGLNPQFPMPNPQSPIPNPQSPYLDIYLKLNFNNYIYNIYINIKKFNRFYCYINSHYSQ